MNRLKYRFWSLFTGFFLLQSLAWAQDWRFFGLFPQYMQSGPITKKLGYSVFVSATSHTMTIKQAETMGQSVLDLQYYVQPSLTFRFTPGVQASIGYAYVHHNLFGVRVNENRLWVQAMLTHGLGSSRLKMGHRIRYEERYPLRLATARWSLAQLARYHVGVTLPFFDPKQQTTGFYGAVSNEAFFCFSGARNSPISAKNAFYGENWSYAGIGYQTKKWGKIEVGYQFQDLVRNPAKDLRQLHLVQVQWATNINLQGLADWLLTPAY